jgi:hypothetical protein
MSSKANTASLQADLSNASKLLKLDQVLNSTYPLSLATANNGKGININSDTTPQYIVNNSISPPGFCITTTKGSTTYKITETGNPTVGNCDSYGLVLSLDAGNTASYPSPFNGTTWSDLSGLGNNGTLVNGVGYSSANGGSLSFDGVNDYVDGGNGTNLNFGLSDFTLEWWDYKTGGTPKPILSDGLHGDSNGSWYIEHYNGSMVIRFYYGSADQNSNSWFSISGLSENRWNHFTIVRDTALLQLKVYLNSNLVYNHPGINVINIIDSSNLWIGNDTRLGQFNGLISKVNFYNRALSSAEITQNFNAIKGRYGL